MSLITSVTSINLTMRTAQEQVLQVAV
jgi:hypothetical protein